MAKLGQTSLNQKLEVSKLYEHFYSSRQLLLMLKMKIPDNKGSSFWLSVLSDLKVRGVKDIIIAYADSLIGLPDAIESVFLKY